MAIYLERDANGESRRDRKGNFRYLLRFRRGDKPITRRVWAKDEREAERFIELELGNWAVRANRLTINPLSRVESANTAIDRRHVRRALTESEIGRLLRVATLRPLAEHGRIPMQKRPVNGEKKKRANWTLAPLTFENIADAATRAREKLKLSIIADLENEGRKRALIYRTLCLTGLRKGELAAIRLSDVAPDGDRPTLTLRAADEKNRHGSTIPIRFDLAAELRSWVADRLLSLQAEARRNGKAIPLALPADARLITVPDGLVKILIS